MTHIERLLAMVSEYLLYVIQREIGANEKDLLIPLLDSEIEANIRKHIERLKKEQFEIKRLVDELKSHLRRE